MHVVVPSESVDFNNVSYDYIDGKVKVSLGSLTAMDAHVPCNRAVGNHND